MYGYVDLGGCCLYWFRLVDVGDCEQVGLDACACGKVVGFVCKGNVVAACRAQGRCAMV